MYAKIIIGVLIVQDLLLGFLLALLPSLKDFSFDNRLLSFVLSLMIAILVFFALRFIVGRFSTVLRTALLNEPIPAALGSFGVCILLAYITHLGALSLELGAFLVGVLFSHRKFRFDDMIIPVKTLESFFECLFFVSIGFNVFPGFLFKEFILIMLITFVIVSIKMGLIFGIMRLALGYPSRTSFAVSCGLGSVSEFAFVLVSKGKRLGLLNREIYYITVATTACSLAITPIVWKIGSRFGVWSKALRGRKSSFRLGMVEEEGDRRVSEELLDASSRKAM